MSGRGIKVRVTSSDCDSSVSRANIRLLRPPWYDELMATLESRNNKAGYIDNPFLTEFNYCTTDGDDVTVDDVVDEWFGSEYTSLTRELHHLSCSPAATRTTTFPRTSEQRPTLLGSSAINHMTEEMIVRKRADAKDAPLHNAEGYYNN
ncbi:unnamed protein product [Haemonchus placei]|uniref:DUF4819 domain-containing protein n=1 Tax=Haemonchus placei TaxID=6290 RepID=A0A0N4WD46_HAEPC|nr:unnamed protein product [Haemonchus placei]